MRRTVKTGVNDTVSDQSLLDVHYTGNQDDPIDKDISQLLEEAGGFGLFQWLIILYSAIAYHGQNFYVFNLAYLELVPALKCQYVGQTEYVD